MTNEMIVLFGALAWGLFCSFVYRTFHRAAWLGAAAVASCLACLGATVGVSTLVPGSSALVPLWVAVLLLALEHLRAAFAVGRVGVRLPVTTGPGPNQVSPSRGGHAGPAI